MKNAIDFDALFDKYLEGYLAEVMGKVKPDLIERQIPAKYIEWLTEPIDELDGLSPNDFVEKLKAENKLGEYLMSYVESGEDISGLIGENCSENEADVLIKIMQEYPEYAMPACAILKDTGTKKADGYLVSIISSPDSDPALVDLAVEMLADGTHENVVPEILSLIDEVDEVTQRNFVDVLYVYPGNDRIYSWIVKLFEREDEMRHVYCNYLGRYGNEDAIELLLNYADTHIMDYYEFMELRNAVEMLGGEMDKDKKYQVVKRGQI